MDGEGLREAFLRVRRRTEALAAPLADEDQQVQSAPDASPTKWHLAHTSWFFEAFVLAPAGHRPFHPRYGYLFNSYYEALGQRHERARRGLLSRPTLEEVRAYRRYVDEATAALLARAERDLAAQLGVHHEQQHQELILTDVKHALGSNPLRPAYRDPRPRPAVTAPPLAWVAHDGGVAEVGHSGDGFCFDNERPRHRVLLQPFALASRLVTCGEYLAFIEDGGWARTRATWIAPPPSPSSAGWGRAARRGTGACWGWICARRPPCSSARTTTPRG